MTSLNAIQPLSLLSLTGDVITKICDHLSVYDKRALLRTCQALFKCAKNIEASTRIRIWTYLSHSDKFFKSTLPKELRNEIGDLLNNNSTLNIGVDWRIKRVLFRSLLSLSAEDVASLRTNTPRFFLDCFGPMSLGYLNTLERVQDAEVGKVQDTVLTRESAYMILLYKLAEAVRDIEFIELVHRASFHAGETNTFGHSVCNRLAQLCMVSLSRKATDEALSLADRIPDDYSNEKVPVLTAICKALADQQRYDEALVIAGRIPVWRKNEKKEALRYIAQARAQHANNQCCVIF